MVGAGADEPIVAGAGRAEAVIEFGHRQVGRVEEPWIVRLDGGGVGHVGHLPP